ncbi:MAG: beta-lactamase family protein [Acidimicrobiia bacterium]|nr:beta-lactamase family protein [Acidimicrobiia bacterium]
MRLTLRALTVLCLVTLIGGAAARAQTAAATAAPPDRAALEKKVDEFLNAHARVNSFSGSVLIAKDGTPLLSKGYGFANIEWQIPNTPQTKFRIGSITKQFTSMLIMQLREQGKVTLEDSLCVYVTPCPDPWKPVTVHHLLTHTSGIPTYTGQKAWAEKMMMPLTPDQVMGFVRDLPLQWVPGEKYAYNNSGYFLLGLIIEKATGKKYEAALAEMILTPLALKDTGYDWTRTILPRRAAGYSGRGPALGNAMPIDMQQPYAAGSMYSTVEDLLEWDQSLYTTTLLPEAAKTVMWTPFLNNYAYGWNIGQADPKLFGGHRRMAHAGGINGFSSVLIRLPDVKMTFIVLANNDGANAAVIGRDLAALYFGQPYSIPSPAAK